MWSNGSYVAQFPTTFPASVGVWEIQRYSDDIAEWAENQIPDKRIMLTDGILPTSADPLSNDDPAESAKNGLMGEI